MKAVEFNLKDPNFGAELIDVDEPTLPNGQWARVAVTVGGICGSDLHLFGSQGLHAPALGGFWTFPFLLGHEIAGSVVEAGDECGIPVGARVAVDPAIPCEARGIHPRCRMCAAGHASCCFELGSRVMTAGMSIGYTEGLGGGWAEQVLGHRSMLHRIPDSVPDSIASLHEPVSVAVHGLLRKPPRNGDPVLVVGAGIIGLAATAAVRHLFPACEVTISARYQHQADAARAVGAQHVVLVQDRYAHFEELAAIVGATVSGRRRGQMLLGGFPYVIEAVGGLDSVTESIRLVDSWGTVLFLGAGGMGEVDLSPLWFKEAELVGAWNHSMGEHPTRGSHHSIDLALDVLAAGTLPESVVTHSFVLDDLRDAVATAIDKRDAHAIKVVFRPNS
ncbi:MAG: zinc-dependent alcohol dehydrogenase [Acidimicrobiia bacterium]